MNSCPAKFDLTALLLNLFLSVILVGGLSGYAVSTSAPGIYLALEQPPLAPPAWVFSVVWTVLYVLIGVSAYLVGQQRKCGAKVSMDLYYALLLLLFLWPLVFFNIQAIGWSVLVLVACLVLAIRVWRNFKFVSPVAGWLLVPLLIWLAFALYLNLGVWVLNR